MTSAVSEWIPRMYPFTHFGFSLSTKVRIEGSDIEWIPTKIVCPQDCLLSTQETDWWGADKKFASLFFRLYLFPVHNATQRVGDIWVTSHQRRCGAAASHGRWFDVTYPLCLEQSTKPIKLFLFLLRTITSSGQVMSGQRRTNVDVTPRPYIDVASTLYTRYVGSRQEDLVFLFFLAHHYPAGKW